jgi:hypothetical protein
MTKFRIMKVGDKYYPQVKYRFFIFYHWMRIGKHTDGFGLYENLAHPHSSKEDALDVIHNYKRWDGKSKEDEVSFEIVD